MHLRALLALLLVATPALGAVVAPESEDLAEQASREVIELHRFIEAWSNGVLDESDQAYRRFGDALAADFVLIGPDGEASRRDAIVSGMRGGHGRWLERDPQGGRIEIRNLEVRATSEPLALVTYEEWHRFGLEERGRISTVLFRRNEKTPGGVEWVHLHEVWIP